ncbi:MAG: glycosyltransferase family 4 protein [Pseudomonadales bacterium]|nr:glycosyltransferase family 4 protein [Pseudomonadales bacterium]
MINILFDTNVLSGGSAIRGIGTYARLLLSEFEKNDELKVYRSSTYSQDEKVKFDIVHYPFFDLFFSTLPISPFEHNVVTIHDVIPLIFPDFYKAGVKGKLRFEKQKFALKTVSAIITDSHASKADIVKFLSIPEEKVHVVYLAANPEMQFQNEKLVRKVLKQNNLPKKYLLYVGDINYNKNIPQLIKMMKFVEDKEIKLVCLGRNFTPQEIPEWKWIETQLALSDVANRVIFLNNVLTESVEELAAIYSGALGYVQPSLYEGFGLPVLEAMQCKTPVISTENSSLIEVGGQNVVFTKPVAEDMAQAVQTVLNWSKTKRTNWIRDAYKWSQTFTWEKTANQTVEVYKKIIEK